MIKTSWINISLGFFLIIALLGTLMRLSPFSSLLINYQHLLHAHSHVAFQGWIYTALFLLITKLYLSNQQIINGKYLLQLKLTLFVILGIMFSFFFQGYGLFSILFSSLFQLLNYWFVFRFLRDIKKNDQIIKHSFSLKFIKVSLWMMLLSTLGPWAVGILSANGLGGSEYFNAALYFFLHFQYNGWFSFAVLGIFFFILEQKNISLQNKHLNFFYLLFTAAVIPSYSLSLLGMSFRSYFIAFGYISGAMQLFALYYLFKFLMANFQLIKRIFNAWIFSLLKIVFIAFSIKMLLQIASVFPFLESFAFSNRYFIISYIHLVMIGFLSLLLIAIISQLSWINTSLFANKFGIALLAIGFIASEIILLLLGFGNLANTNQTLILMFSLMMTTGISLLLAGQFLKKK